MICSLSILMVFHFSIFEARPMISEEIGMRFMFFKNDSRLLERYNISVLADKPFVVFVHGFQSSPEIWRTAEVRQTLVERMDVNVILVDWSKWSQVNNYEIAVIRSHIVAAYLANWLSTLHDQRVIKDYDNVTLIGHSLGAHIVGIAGRMLDSRIKRIIALDPAMPGFGNDSGNNGVNVDSGQFVMVLHTATMLLGLKEPIGHVDFYFNGGMLQPSCDYKSTFDKLICSHSKATEYLIKSLKNPTKYLAYKCHTLENCENMINDLNEPTIYMNITIPITTRGLYSVVT
ncbi:lipase member H-like isoform X2 [Adelges cooleyi]|uniref:lipase member H-like isoform X2 n=1 Tax=Adelges cooleyi TaxID=133065 RepID=UPI00217FCE2F|nr:lipase member H-like isoform X2 [Adelges cooleyi]